MKNILSVFISIVTVFTYSQDKEAIDWINHHSIEIEDANPDSELVIFKQKIPDKFANAKV